jgi:hypothetical protein
LTWKAVGDDLDIGTGKYWKPYLSFDGDGYDFVFF